MALLYINPLTFHTPLKANIKSQGSLTSDLGDILAGVRHLKHGKGLAFGDRVGIWGGSFGGYMTMRALAVTDVFQVCLPCQRWRTSGEDAGPCNVVLHIVFPFSSRRLGRRCSVRLCPWSLDDA